MMLRSGADTATPSQPVVACEPRVWAPFERTAIDVAVRFPRSHHYRYFVIAKGFTKGSEAYAVHNQEASMVIEALVTRFICRFRVPREPHSDQECNFKFHLMQMLHHLGGVHDMHHPTPTVGWYGGAVC